MPAKLTEEDIKQRLIDSGRTIELVSYGNGILDTSSRWRCIECEHEWNTAANGILNSGRGCPSCSNRIPNTSETVRQKLIDDNRPIILLSFCPNMLNPASRWKCTECDHEWASSANTVINKGSGCPSCANHIPWSPGMIDQRLIDNNRTILLVAYGKNSHDNSSLWKCTECDWEWNTATYSILSNGTGCPSCANQVPLTPEIIDQRLIDDDRPIILLSYGKKANNNSSLWKCTECDWEWSTSANSIFSNGTGCPACAGQVPLTPEIIGERLGSRAISLISHGKDTNDRSSRWRCIECDHEWATSSSNILNNGHGCPSCATTGFNPCKPAHFYIHTFNDFVKIGITNRPERRKAQLNNQLINETLYIIEDTISWYFENGGDAVIVESMVLEAFKGRQYTKLLGTSFDGRTELLDISLHDELIDLMAKVMVTS